MSCVDATPPCLGLGFTVLGLGFRDLQSPPCCDCASSATHAVTAHRSCAKPRSDMAVLAELKPATVALWRQSGALPPCRCAERRPTADGWCTRQQGIRAALLLVELAFGMLPA